VDDRQGPLHAMVQCAPHPLAYEVAQRHHSVHKEVPRHVLLIVSVGLDPQVVAHRGDGALE
jgi:hypothetical protein